MCCCHWYCLSYATTHVHVQAYEHIHVLLRVLHTHNTVHVHSSRTICVQCKSPTCIPPFYVQCISQAIHDTLPFKAKVMMERLIAVSQDAVFKLETEPISTLDFVNLLKLVYAPPDDLYLGLACTHFHTRKARP